MPEGLNKKQLAEDYGYALSFMKSDPELWSLFNKATKQNWTDAEFEAKLKDSKWYQNHSDVYRKNAEQKASDPGTWDQRLDETRLEFEDIAASMGVSLGGSALRRMAKDALMYGWSDSKIRNKMSGYIDTVKGTSHYGGEAGATEDSLRKLGMDYGQKVSSGTLQKWVVNIARGDATEQDFKAVMQDRAEQAYPAYAEQIKKGMTIRDAADPFLEQMASTLELNAANLDVFDKTVQKALTHKRADNNKGNEYSMWDFELDLRQDPRFAKTKGAQDAAMGVAQQVAKDWGFLAN